MSEIWVTLAVDQVEQSVIVVGFAQTKKECKEHRSRVDTPYIKSFRLFEKGPLGNLMCDWFQKCGIPLLEAHEAVRGIGKELADIWNIPIEQGMN